MGQRQMKVGVTFEHPAVNPTGDGQGGFVGPGEHGV